MQSWGAVGVALLVPLLSSVPATAQCAPGGTNLAGWWPGDNHAYNVINQRAATVQGTVTYAPGMVGDAFHFEGTGKVRIPEATSIDLSRLSIRKYNPEWYFQNTLFRNCRVAPFANSIHNQAVNRFCISTPD